MACRFCSAERIPNLMVWDAHAVSVASRFPESTARNLAHIMIHTSRRSIVECVQRVIEMAHDPQWLESKSSFSSCASGRDDPHICPERLFAVADLSIAWIRFVIDKDIDGLAMTFADMLGMRPPSEPRLASMWIDLVVERFKKAIQVILSDTQPDMEFNSKSYLSSSLTFY